MAFCTNCGKPVADGAAFCTNCGKALAAAQPAPVVEETPVAAPAVEETPVAAPAVEEAPATPVAEEVPAAPAEAPKTFCTRCGAALNPGSAFCTACGQNLGAPVAPVAAPAKKVNGKLIGLIVGAVAVVVAVVILLICLLGGGGKAGSYEEAVDNYFDRMIACEFTESDIEDAVPEAVLKAVEGGAPALSARMIKEFASTKVMMESVDLEWEIVKAQELNASNLKEAIEDFELDEFAMDVTAGCKLSVKITMEMFGMSNATSETFYAFEIDGDWYLFDEVFEEAVDMVDFD